MINLIRVIPMPAVVQTPTVPHYELDDLIYVGLVDLMEATLAIYEDVLKALHAVSKPPHPTWQSKTIRYDKPSLTPEANNALKDVYHLLKKRMLHLAHAYQETLHKPYIGDLVLLFGVPFYNELKLAIQATKSIRLALFRIMLQRLRKVRKHYHAQCHYGIHERLALRSGSLSERLLKKLSKVNLEVKPGYKIIYMHFYHLHLTTKPLVYCLRGVVELFHEPERFGVAVYDTEQSAKNTLRQAEDGYVIACIPEAMDVTSSRPPRFDVYQMPVLAILNVKPIELREVITFSGQHYFMKVDEAKNIMLIPSDLIAKKKNT
jgi:hypothetical protein